jgi:tetratricopeptide (TPR) repeat protein
MSSYLDSPDSDSEVESPSTHVDEDKKAEVLSSIQNMKAEGNAYFSQNNYEKALELYTCALKTLKEFQLEKDSIILLNRSATYLALKRYVPALNDANQGTVPSR